MTYRHIIWDWNGTLLNDRWLCIESINQLLSDRRIQSLSEEKYLEIFGFPVRDYYERAGFDFSREDFKVPALQFIDLYDRKRKECELNDNALETLEHFKRTGLGQSLLSASGENVLKDMIAHFKLDNFFSHVTGLNNHYAVSKLELGINLLEKIGRPPGEIIMIGDTAHDTEVARELGVDIILYDRGHFPRHRLNGCGCRIISDLAVLIEELTN
jgi:phosphoglycolate phosphatase